MFPVGCPLGFTSDEDPATRKDYGPCPGTLRKGPVLIMSKDLQGYRQEIDRIDDELLRLLNERSRSVIEIGKLKKLKDSEAHLHTPAREAEIIDRLTKL